jgi:hypothetical protein
MRQDDFTRGLWIGWAIGTGLLLISFLVFVVTQ